MIVGISGKQCSGKDTLSHFVLGEYTSRQFAFADKVKEQIQRAIFELTGETVDPWADKGEPLGPMLQFYGTEVMRRYRTSIWVDYLMEKVLAPWLWENPRAVAVITDLRFPNEAQAVRDAGGVLVRVERPPVERIKDVVQLYGQDGLNREGHISETALDSWEGWDLLIKDKTPVTAGREMGTFLRKKMA